MNATGPIAVVTGAAGALGSAACGKLADAGFLVLASDADGAAAAALVAGLPGSGHRGMAADVADEESVARLFEVAESELGPVTALVTFAGILMMEPGRRPSIASSTLAEWRRTFEVNAFGTFLCIREMARLRLKKPVANGRIVTISSIAAQIGSANSSSAYAASKGAVISLTKSAARELAPLGITVNAIAPGVFESAIMRRAVPQDAEERLLQQIPAGRFGHVDEIASTVAFLASEGAGYITGTVVPVNGGFRI